MKTLMTAGVVLVLACPAARADEHRGGDAALGALSGAVVFGPIGAVAGAVVGYTAGPSIAHSWGFRSSSSAKARRSAGPSEAAATARDVRTPQISAPKNQPAPPVPAAPPAAPPAPTTTSALPPVQSLE